jgi:hypothetical protein
MPTVATPSNKASCKIVPTPQKGSSKVLPALQEDKFTIILANLGGMPKIAR